MMVKLQVIFNDWFFDKMKHLGFEHEGFTKGFDPIKQIRYHSVLDLKIKHLKIY